jgi:arylsulfatase A-like enzyme
MVTGRLGAAAVRPASVDRPNVVLVVLDSLRRDHLGVFGYERPTSPTIDRLAREGVLLRDIIAAAPQTAPAVASLFTGLYPHAHGIQLYSYNQSFDPVRSPASPELDSRFPVLAERFRTAGYATFALVENPWIKPEFGFARGFDHFDSIESWDGRHISGRFGSLLNDGSTTRPFFAYLHYMDVHAPYFASGATRGLYAPFQGPPVFGNGLFPLLRADEKTYALDLYDERLNVLDELVRGLIEVLTREGLRDNTLLVVTADHGEEFLEHRGLGHGTSLYAELINTFAIFDYPGRLRSRVVRTRARSVDLAPTILDLAGLDPFSKTDPVDGRSLRAWMEGPRAAAKVESPEPPFVLAELGDKKAVLMDGWKFVYDLGLKTEELFHEGRDPGDRENLADAKLRIRAKLKETLLREIAAASGSGAPSGGTPGTVSPELERRLASLGYLGGGASSPKSRSLAALRAPITADIDFSRGGFNPLQLVFGWGDPSPRADRVYAGLETNARAVLTRGVGGGNSLRIEGRTADETPVNAGPAFLRVVCEGKYLRMSNPATSGGAAEFAVEFEIPRGLGRDRPLMFILNAGRPLLISSLRLR